MPRFVLAVRQAHHQQGISFLRDILGNATLPDGRAGVISDDARFLAAVGLAEWLANPLEVRPLQEFLSTGDGAT